MANEKTVTCQIRYQVDLSKLSEFETYARAWAMLVERYGGLHHGFFVPRETPKDVPASFPEVGHDGPNDVAIALFSFPNESCYLSYRERASADLECRLAEALFRETHCFISYERLFLKPLDSAMDSTS